MTSKPNRARLASLFQIVSTTQQGFAEALAKVSGTPVSQQQVQLWLKRENVPGQWVQHIVKASGGEITTSDLRPDIFGA